jgi:hypothetical protein
MSNLPPPPLTHTPSHPHPHPHTHTHTPTPTPTPTLTHPPIHLLLHDVIGWQLGEHGEWCKHTNFNLATNAPMIIHIPGLTDAGITTTTPTEYLDLMPTLAEAAAGIIVPACPEGNTSHISCVTPCRFALFVHCPRTVLTLFCSVPHFSYCRHCAHYRY